MKDRHVIAISGRISHGKDEFFRIAKKYYPTEVIKCSFADCLKREVAEALVCRHTAAFKEFLLEILEGIPYYKENVEAIFEQTFDTKTTSMNRRFRDYYAEGYDRSFAIKTLIAEMNDPVQKQKFRLLLQFWGTEYRRRQDEQYWVNKFFEELQNEKYDGMFVFVCDARFPNEFETLYGEGAIMVRVIRTDIPTVEREHLSETALDAENRWHHVIYNDGTPNYEDKVLEVLKTPVKTA